eukprot:2122661-Rhodomonas_salina.4
MEGFQNAHTPSFPPCASSVKFVRASLMRSSTLIQPAHLGRSSNRTPVLPLREISVVTCHAASRDTAPQSRGKEVSVPLPCRTNAEAHR